MTVKPSHELPDRISAIGFGFGAASGGEAESKPDAPRLSLHEKLAFGRKPEKTRKRVPYARRPSSEKKRPVIDWTRSDEEEREDVRRDESEEVSAAFSEYFAANTDFGASFGSFGQKKDSAVDFTTATTTTSTTTKITTTTTRRPVQQEQEVYHVTPSAVEPPSWQQQWTTQRPTEEHKKSHKKPIFKKPAFQQANLQGDVEVESLSEVPAQSKHRETSDDRQQSFQHQDHDQLNGQDQNSNGHFDFMQQQHQQQQQQQQQQNQQLSHPQTQHQQQEQHQQQDQFSQEQKPQPKPFSQPIDPFAPIKDPFSQSQGPSFSSPQESLFNPHQQQFHQQQFQPATPDREASISVTSGPNLSSGPGSGIQQLPGPTFGGQPSSAPVARPPRPFGRPPNRPPRPGRPQRPPVGERRPVQQQQNRPALPTGGRPVAGFAGRPPVPLNGRPVRPAPQGDARPGSRPPRPPPTKSPSGGGYLDSFLNWFRGGDGEEEQETRPLPPNARPGATALRPQHPRPRPQDGRPQSIPSRPNESQRPALAPQGFPPSFGGGPSAPFAPPPPPQFLPGHGPDGKPTLERAPGSFVRHDPSPTTSGAGFGTGSRPGESFGVLPQFRPGVAGVPRLAHRRRGTVQRRRGPAARQPNQQTVLTKTSKPSASPAVSQVASETTTDYVVATPSPRRRRPMRPQPAASLSPPRRRVEGRPSSVGRPASEDPRPPLVGRPTARPATLLNDKRIVVVGPFGAPPPGAPYIQHPEQLTVTGGDVIARNASPARRVQGKGAKMSGKPAVKSAMVTRRVVTEGTPTSAKIGAKLNFTPSATDGATVKAALAPAVVSGQAGVAKAPSQPLEAGSPEVSDVTEGKPGEFREPELYSGFRPILN